VVRVGFQLPLEISGGFLPTYLTFNTDNIAKNPENCSAILIVYLQSLDSCQQRNTAFYALASHLCSIGHRYHQIRQLIEPFLLTLVSIFADVVLQAMSLWKPGVDWRRMNEFRRLAENFYEEMLPAFVWLQSRSQVIVSITVLVSFFIIELTKSKENWMISASFEALLVALDLRGRELSPDLLELALRTALRFKRSDEVQLLINSAALLQPTREWNSLRSCILSFAMAKPFSPMLFAYLLKTDEQRALARFAFSIGHAFVEAFREAKIDVPAATALFVILFGHSPDVIGPLCEHAIAVKKVSTQFKLMLIGLGFKGGNKVLGGIPRYLLSVFKNGGMHFVSQMLLTRPAVGIALLSKGAAKAAFLLALRDVENARAYLWFVQLAVITIEQSDRRLAGPFASSVLRLCLKVVEKWSNDPLNGRMIFWHAVRIMKDVTRILGAASETLFEECSGDEKQMILAIIQQHVEAEIQNRKMQELVEFSTNDRGKRRSEWTELEIGDSD
jgi:hypothetical protein